MNNNIFNKKDELIMSLVHYFVTEEDYSPINVRGAKNEIWLENLEAPYKIIRINSKYIHNEEQYNMDIFKLGFVVRQIKRKTLSFKMKVLNICLDMNDSVKLEEVKNINTISVNSISDLKKNKFLGELFPKIKTERLKRTDDIIKVLNATEDINKKTTKENNKYEEVFKPKKIIVTKIIIILCIIMYFLSLFISDNFNYSLLILGANNKSLVLKGEIYRLIACAFLHGGILHLVVNMYSLWIVGSQVENYIGKFKYIIIYLLSALMGSMFSLVFLGNSISIGASGAIFGLMGSLLYFGYHYRLYLSNALTNQLIPIIILNLFLGFCIDNMAHIGGLVGGYLATMIVGVKYKSTKSEMINGIIVYLLLIAFLTYAILKLA